MSAIKQLLEAAKVASAFKVAVKTARRSNNATAYALVLPAFIAMIGLLIGPAIGVFIIALTDWSFGSSTFSFVGLQNFKGLLSNDVFLISLRNTALYVLMVVPTTVGLALFIALMIESGPRFRAFYRAVHFLPVMATLAAMAIAWEALLHPTIGLVNQVLAAMGLPRPNWLRDGDFVLFTLAAIGIWQHLGYAMVLFLAGIKAIPSELYDAAEIDGADRGLDRLRTVTLPLLGPVTMFIFIVVALKAFETFDTVQVLTEGRPGNKSELLLHTLFVESFQNLRTGSGGAMTVVFLAIVISITLFQMKIFDKRVHYS